MILAFFDFETTDKEVKEARVTQLAVALYDSETQKMLGCYSNTLYSEEYPPMNPGAEAVTGISDAYLKRCGELPRESFIILMHYFGKADYVVGHNIRLFDLPILKEEMERMLLPIEKVKNVIDTRFDIIYPDHIQTRKLGYLALEHGIQVVGAHAAINDVMTNAALFFRYDIEKTIELSKSPDMYIRADVKFDDRQKAKDKKYNWDGVNKIWVKQIKEMHYANEKQTSDFEVLKLENYTPAEAK